MRTKTLVAALAVGALVVPLTSAMSAPAAAPQARPCTAQWQLVPLPEQAPGVVEGQTVSAISPRDVRIAGTASTGSAWTMRWDGRAVTETAAPPQGPLRTIDGMRTSSSYASPDEGWLLLNYPTRLTGGIDTVAHWQNGRWTQTPTAVPDDPVADLEIDLLSVVSLAADDAWAVGTRSDADGFPLGLIEHWNGSEWTIVDHPESTARGTALHDVTAVSPTDIWAVGEVSPETGSWTDARPLVMHYDGTSWTTIPTPEVPKEQRPAQLRSVSVTDDGQVWAVGLRNAAEGVFGTPLIMRYDGSAWQQLPDPGVGTRINVVGVYAAAKDDAWVVATDGSPNALLHWDGTSWQRAEWPGPKLYRQRYIATDIDGTGPNDIWVSASVQRMDGAGEGLVPVTVTPQVAHLSCGKK